jgi:multidrug efflux pump subunit AcrB
VLAATFTTMIVFFPVTFLSGVSQFLFTALAAAVVLSLAASYIVAMTVVPLYCAKLMKKHEADEEIHGDKVSAFGRIVRKFNLYFDRMLHKYDRTLALSLARPVATVVGLMGVFLLSLALYPLLGVSFFPRTDPGQFVINLKAPPGLRIELTEKYVARIEEEIRTIVPRDEMGMIVSNIGITPDFSAMYTSNSGQNTAFIQVSLKEDHKVGSYEYMDRVRKRLAQDIPEVATYFQSGGLVDAVLNFGLPAPVDVQVSGSNLEKTDRTALALAAKIRGIKGVNDVLIPQDLDYPAIRLDVDRERASMLGLDQKEVVDNVITALNSNGMIAPSYWVDPRSGNDYLLTVQYRENQIKSLNDLKQIPLRSSNGKNSTPLDSVVKLTPIESPTEVDHYQLRRVIDLYVAPATENLGGVTKGIQKVLKDAHLPEGVHVDLRGSVQGMNQSFTSFGFGLILSVVLVFLILVAQFQSFIDPFVILLAIPPGITGVIVLLLATGTTLNVMSLMGVVMMVGIVVSNSILIVEFTRTLREEGKSMREAVATACRVRLRPILMTSLATILGLIPMALKLGTGSEAYAPLARAIIGGLLVSVVITVYLVPAAYILAHRNDKQIPEERIA